MVGTNTVRYGGGRLKWDVAEWLTLVILMSILGAVTHGVLDTGVMLASGALWLAIRGRKEP